MVLERRAFRSEAGVDPIGQTYVKLARSFDPAKTQVRRRLPAGGRWIRTIGPPPWTGASRGGHASPDYGSAPGVVR